MEDSEGIVVDFKNTLVLMTSNAGSELLESIGNSEEISVQDVIGLMPLLQQQLKKPLQRLPMPIKSMKQSLDLYSLFVQPVNRQ